MNGSTLRRVIIRCGHRDTSGRRCCATASTGILDCIDDLVIEELATRGWRVGRYEGENDLCPSHCIDQMTGQMLLFQDVP